jgi:prevent-host-death family protein
MTSASISDAKNRLSALIDRVRQGETVIITDRDQPVAQLAPLSCTPFGEHARLTELERAGLIKRPKSLLTKAALRKLPPMPPARADVLGALLAERDDGR